MSEQPFELGFRAGFAGDDPRTCPYEKMTLAWREWQRWHGFACELVPDPDKPTRAVGDLL